MQISTVQKLQLLLHQPNNSLRNQFWSFSIQVKVYLNFNIYFFMHSNFHLNEVTCQAAQGPCASFHIHFFLNSIVPWSQIFLWDTSTFWLSYKWSYFLHLVLFPKPLYSLNQNVLLLYSFDIGKPIWMGSWLQFYTLTPPLLD